MPYHTLNIQELCAYLRLAPADVELLVRRQEIPFEKKGQQLVFRKTTIDSWASQRILGFSKQSLKGYCQTASAKLVDISKQDPIVAKLIRKENIHPALTSRTKPSLLRDMVALADQTGLLLAPADLLLSLQKREELCSTALPEGIALLHPRHLDPYLFEDSFIMLGRAGHPLPFGAPDGSTTDLFFLFCCQADRLYLHVLARLCLMCRSTRVLQEMREAPDAEAIHAALVRSEQEVIKRQ